MTFRLYSTKDTPLHWSGSVIYHGLYILSGCFVLNKEEFVLNNYPQNNCHIEGIVIVIKKLYSRDVISQPQISFPPCGLSWLFLIPYRQLSIKFTEEAKFLKFILNMQSFNVFRRTCLSWVFSFNFLIPPALSRHSITN